MEKKNSCVRAGFSTILWGVLAILLCAAPCVWAEDIDITEPVQGDLWVLSSTTVNLSADVGGTIWVEPNSHLNIHSGDVDGLGVVVLEPVQGEPNAVVTVYGTDFAVDGTPYETPASVDIPDGTLTGKYRDGSDINLVFMSDVPIFLAAPAIAVDIDIKPGSYPNSLNINGHGVIPVAILGSADFDVTQIDFSTLRFAGLEVRVKGNGAPQCSIKDVSGDFTNPEGAPDGYQDLVCQFVDNPDTWLPGEGVAKLMGNLLDGTPIEGTDEIIIVPPAE